MDLLIFQVAYLPYLVPNFEALNGGANGTAGGSLRLTNGQLATTQQSAAAATKPVTVRSVKRRDKAKMEEKRMMSQLESTILANRINHFQQQQQHQQQQAGDDADEEEAVMV